MSDNGKSRAVLLTGAAGGVGQATAKALNERGFQVYAGVRADSAGLEKQPGVRVVQLDVTDPDSIAKAAAEVGADLDGRGLHGLHGVVNNAGIIVQGAIELVPDSEMQRQFAVNVFGPMQVTRAFLPLLRAGGGRLVNISAVTARIAVPFFGPISASKAALESLSDALRIELAHWGIPVSIVEPGSTDTEIMAKSMAVAKATTESLPPEQVGLYAAQFAAIAAAAADRNSGEPPKVVADVIVKALTASKPKPLYTAGREARLFGMVSHLPTRTRDRLLTRTLGLSKVPSAAAAKRA